MKLIKLAGISLFILFLILTAMGLLLPSTVRVTRNITLSVAPDTLHQYLSNMAEWRLWMEGMDTSHLQVDSLSGNQQKQTALIGNMQIALLQNTTKKIETQWRNSNGKSQLCVFELTADTLVAVTHLTWYFEQKVSWYPWERLPTIANDKILGPFMEQSLDKLKAITEQSVH